MPRFFFFLLILELFFFSQILFIISFFPFISYFYPCIIYYPIISNFLFRSFVLSLYHFDWFSFQELVMKADRGLFDCGRCRYQSTAHGGRVRMQKLQLNFLKWDSLSNSFCIWQPVWSLYDCLFFSFSIYLFSFLFAIAFHDILASLLFSLILFIFHFIFFAHLIQLDIKIEEDSSEIKFKLQDTHDEYGPMAKDLRVRYIASLWCHNSR